MPHDAGASQAHRQVQSQRAKTRSSRASRFLAYGHTSVTRASVTLSAAICRVWQPPSTGRIDENDGGGLIVARREEEESLRRGGDVRTKKRTMQLRYQQ